MTADEQARVDVLASIVDEYCGEPANYTTAEIVQRIIAADPATEWLKDATVENYTWQTQLATAQAEVQRLKANLAGCQGGQGDGHPSKDWNTRAAAPSFKHAPGAETMAQSEADGGLISQAENKPPLWMPISTAPRDGTTVWGFSKQQGMCLMRWRESDHARWHTIHGVWKYYDPELWQPLPPPPGATVKENLTVQNLAPDSSETKFSSGDNISPEERQARADALSEASRTAHDPVRDELVDHLEQMHFAAKMSDPDYKFSHMAVVSRELIAKARAVRP